MLTFKDYETQAAQTAVYPQRGNNLYYPTLGLCGEAGEVAEKIKKIMRDCGGGVSPEANIQLVKEIGDVLWYLAALSFELGISLEVVAQANLDKLADRKNRAMLHGNGDNR